VRVVGGVSGRGSGQAGTSGARPIGAVPRRKAANACAGAPPTGTVAKGLTLVMSASNRGFLLISADPGTAARGASITACRALGPAR
jgi:hypothetical protein